ncbi:MAG: ornithine carbamoyltransferase [Acidobacteria bacterium]|nr:ornithine carbamoyltransferase [Acidobacteriota bacterium]
MRTLTRLSCPDLLSVQDLSPAEVEGILDLAGLVKSRPEEFRSALAGRHLVLIFEKPSLRTRVTFEVGMADLGGRALFIDQTHAPLGGREKLCDIARNLERWVDGIVLRTFTHQTVSEMAAHAAIPVINGLSDREHPCQALGDYFTLQERFTDLRRVKLAFVGDGNNVCHSLLLTAALLGSHIAVATPPGYEPAREIVAAAADAATRTGAHLELTHDWQAAVTGADAVYTDVWASMGQESEAEQRRAVFAPYQVNEGLMARAAPHAVFLHCLPAHRGEEVTDAVIDSPQSGVYDQAENRLHVQKAILLLLLGNGQRRTARLRGARG